MPRNSYQYGTSPRKYDMDYIDINKKTYSRSQKTNNKKIEEPKAKTKNNVKKAKNKNIQVGKNRALQVVTVLAIFGMLLTVSYREIAIMEMFNQKKNLENNLAVIQKEDGQVEKSIKEVESTLDWNSIQQKATEQLGMQKKSGTPVDLDKADNVETSNKLIKEEKTSVIDRIIEYFINK